MSITNIGGSRAAIAGFIRPSGGKDYRIDTRYLESGETIVFDIKQIRDKQIPDPKGIKLASHVTAGQFEWSSILGDGKERLIGRADITSLSLGVSSPPTYYQCNCPLSAISAFVTPGNPLVGVGGETSATTEVVYQNICVGGEVDAAFAALNWLIQNPPVMSLTTKASPSTMKGLSAGTSTFSTTFSGQTWSFSPSNGCQSSGYKTYTAAGTGTVATVTFSGTPVVPAGKTAPITATVSPSSNTMPITLTLSTTSGSGSAVFLNTGVSTTTITTTTVLTVVGGQASSVPNNISLTATVTAESKQMTVGSTTLTIASSSGALPVNFLQTGVTTLSGAALQFTYTWGSSSGSLSDISTCNVREFVTYPGYVQGQQLNYYWTSPPYVNAYSPNPTTGAPGPASGGGLTDIQSSVGFVKPYAANSVTSSQVYQFQCPYYQNNQWVQFAPQSGTIPITRVVQQAGNTWQYTITKSGSSATGTLP